MRMMVNSSSLFAVLQSLEVWTPLSGGIEWDVRQFMARNSHQAKLHQATYEHCFGVLLFCFQEFNF